jgi:hypothetical protein
MTAECGDDAMAMSQDAVRTLVKDQLIPAWLKERERLDRIDKWLRWECENVQIRRQGSTREVRALVEMAKTPLLKLVVETLAQELLVESYRTTDPLKDDAPSWRHWTANRMPSRQYALHSAAIGYGMSYTLVLPGEDALTGEDMARIDCKSPRRFMAFYRDPEGDDYPEYGIEVSREPGDQWFIDVFDDDTRYRLTMGTKGGDAPQYIDDEPHGMPVCPVVRYSTFVDLEGRADGRIEPFITTAARAQKTLFDRLLIQHYNSWKVRTISGISLPEQEELANRERLKLQQSDFLVAASAETRFGSLDETSVGGVVEAYKSDLGTLATVGQIPVHAITGDMTNLSADAIKESRISLEHLSAVSKLSLSDSHKMTLGLSAIASGQKPDLDASIGWADTDSRSMAQAADALGKLAEMLQVPRELLWEDIPGWDQAKVDRAKAIIEQGGSSIDQLLAQLNTMADGGGGLGSAPAAPAAVGAGVGS